MSNEAPDFSKSKFQKRTVIRWRAPVDGSLMEGIVQDVSWAEDSIPAWAVDYFPRFLWWMFWRKENTFCYEVRGTDGILYSIHEHEVIT